MTRLCRNCLIHWVESPFRVCESCDEPRERGEWREESEEAIKQERRKVLSKLEALDHVIDGWRIGCRLRNIL